LGELEYFAGAPPDASGVYKTLKENFADWLIV
jgi:hypothetical protein